MYWNMYNRPVRWAPVRRGTIGGVSPYPDRQVELAAEAEVTQTTPPPASEAVVQPAAEETNWQEVALRLQAEMDNFRKRQTRRADEAIAAERERLLRRILPVADNLARALRHDNQKEETLRQGVELIQRELLRILEAEGVSRIETVGQPFSPELHEALATVPAQAEPNRVVEEVEAGYMLAGKLLRPARVVVAAA